mmetsp:Transcript_644/g.1276  ORF Transcript_644/g.1276 Transcript_644/m.1276 type:complete len:222 (+) Transcript_644:653-1318(+)
MSGGRGFSARPSLCGPRQRSGAASAARLCSSFAGALRWLACQHAWVPPSPLRPGSPGSDSDPDQPPPARRHLQVPHPLRLPGCPGQTRRAEAPGLQAAPLRSPPPRWCQLCGCPPWSACAQAPGRGEQPCGRLWPPTCPGPPVLPLGTPLVSTLERDCPWLRGPRRGGTSPAPASPPRTGRCSSPRSSSPRPLPSPSARRPRRCDGAPLRGLAARGRRGRR